MESDPIMKLPSHILIIRLSAMGDVAMTVPVIMSLTQTYPNLKCTVITKPNFKPLFEGIKNLEILEADLYGKHKGIRLVNLAKAARSLGIDAVADLHNVIRSKIITRYFKINGIKVSTIDKGRAEKKALTRKKNKIFTPLKTTHQRYADVFSKLGLAVELSYNEKAKRKELTNKTQEFIGKEPKKCIGIAPFAAYKSKTYPMDLMEEVISKLDGNNQFRILLFGGGEEEICVLNNLEKKYSSVKNVAGKISFKDELSLISNLDLMISMDSGNGHLAALFEIPVITLWGVTHPFSGFAPYGQPEENGLLSDRKAYPLIPTSVYGNKYPKGYKNAIRTITPEIIIIKIMELI